MDTYKKSLKIGFNNDIPQFDEIKDFDFVLGEEVCPGNSKEDILSFALNHLEKFAEQNKLKKYLTNFKSIYINKPFSITYYNSNKVIPTEMGFLSTDIKSELLFEYVKELLIFYEYPLNKAELRIKCDVYQKFWDEFCEYTKDIKNFNIKDINQYEKYVPICESEDFIISLYVFENSVSIKLNITDNNLFDKIENLYRDKSNIKLIKNRVYSLIIDYIKDFDLWDNINWELVFDWIIRETEKLYKHVTVLCNELSDNEQVISEEYVNDMTLDLSEDFTEYYTMPYMLKYKGRIINIKNLWKSLYVEFFKIIFSEYSHKFYVGQKFIPGKRKDFGKGDDFRDPVNIVNDLYLETNLSARDIVKRIKEILDLCQVSYSDVEIHYKEKEELGIHTKPEDEKYFVRNDSIEMYGRIWDRDNYTELLKKFVIEIQKFNSFGPINNYKFNDKNLLSSIGLGNFSEKVMYGMYLNTDFSIHDVYWIIRDVSDLYNYNEYYNALFTEQAEYSIDISRYEDEVLELLKDYDKGINLDLGGISRLRNECLKDSAVSDEVLKEIIKKNYIEKDGYYYKLSTLIKPLTAEKIKEFLKTEVFEKGYYCALGSEIHKKYFWELSYLNEDNLLYYLCMYDGFYRDGDYLAESEDSPANIIADIIKIMEEKCTPMTCEEIAEIHPCINSDTVKYVLNSNKNNYFLYCGENKFIHASFFEDKNLKAIVKVVTEYKLEKSEFTTRKEILNVLKLIRDDEKFGIYDSFNIVSDTGFKNAISYLLRDEYRFENDKIFRNDTEKRDYYKEYLKERSEASLSQLFDYLKENRVTFKLAKVLKYKMRIDRDRLIDKSLVEFDIEETDKALDVFLTEMGYCSFKNVNPAHLPRVKIKGEETIFNEYLLEAFIIEYSKKYYNCRPHYDNIDVVGCYGIEDFNYNDIMIDALVNSGYVDLTEEKATDFLVGNGYYLIKRKNKKFYDVLEKARKKIGL